MYAFIKSQFSQLFANKKLLIPIVLSLFIPALYGAILLTSKMHPTDHVDNLPVAVVNNDQGFSSDGDNIQVGEQLVEKLKESKSLNWDFVDTATAMDGLQNNDYYMVIVIPEDFSKNVTTLTDPNPKKLKLEYIQNEGLNFTAATITDRASETIRSQLEETIIKEFATKVVTQVGDGLEEAADGSEQLAEGTAKLQEGTEQLNQSVLSKVNDIARLASGSQELKAGMNELNQSVVSKTNDIARLASGSQELKAGTNELLSNLKGNTGNINKLADGSQELANGASKLQEGTGKIYEGLQQAKSGSETLHENLTNKIAPGTQRLAEGSKELAEGVDTFVTKVNGLIQLLPLLGIDPSLLGIDLEQTKADLKRLNDGAQELSAGADELNQAFNVNGGSNNGPFVVGLATLDAGLSELVNGQKEVVAGATQLEAGAQQVADGTAGVKSGWNALTAGATQLDAGAAQIAQGNATVNEGWKALAVGSTKLNNGASQIADGNAQVNEGWKTLADGSTELNEGAKQLKDGSEQLAEGLASGAANISPLKDGEENINMFASPIEVATERINSPEFYRDTTAPLVMSLGLFVGILIMSLFMNFNRPADVTPMTWFISRFVNLTLLAFVQAALLLIYALAIIRMQVTNPGMLILTLFVAAITFSAIVMLLAAVAGHVGRFIAIAIVLLQLPTTGGDLPIIMLSDGLKSLSTILPFTYSIAGIRTALLLGNVDQIVYNILILIVFAVVALGLTLIVYMFKKDKNITDAEETDVTPSGAF